MNINAISKKEKDVREMEEDTLRFYLNPHLIQLLSRIFERVIIYFRYFLYHLAQCRVNPRISRSTDRIRRLIYLSNL